MFIIGLDILLNLGSSESKNLIPKIAIIVAALGYVVSSIIAYNIKDVSTISLTTFVTITAALISIPFMFYGEINYPSTFNSSALLAIIYLGIFPTAIAFQIRFHIISKAGPIFLSYVAYLIPVFSIIWGYVFLKEKITFEIMLGVILILLGVFISQKKSSKTIND